jgi:hypothetical protein
MSRQERLSPTRTIEIFANHRHWFFHEPLGVVNVLAGLYLAGLYMNAGQYLRISSRLLAISTWACR